MYFVVNYRQFDLDVITVTKPDEVYMTQTHMLSSQRVQKQSPRMSTTLFDSHSN